MVNAASAIEEIIKHPREERNIEFKESVAWEDIHFKAKITKSILGMANLRDGGWIIIGKRRNNDGSYESKGMIPDHFATYDSDLMQDFVRDYADPPIEIVLHKIEVESKQFIAIRVEEFERIPILCKRSCAEVIHRGKMYTRSKSKPETIEVPSEIEMREIIELATDKNITSFRVRAARLGMLTIEQVMEIIARSQDLQSDKERFDEQIRRIGQ
jgi:predicted HTH transcriptional regulator